MCTKTLHNRIIAVIFFLDIIGFSANLSYFCNRRTSLPERSSQKTRSELSLLSRILIDAAMFILMGIDVIVKKGKFPEPQVSIDATE